jgi:serine/threonine protein kinase
MLLSLDSVKKGPIIGKGGFGCVHKGSLDRMDVALKVFEGASLHGSVLEDIKRECALLQKLQHENIVRFYGLVVEPHEAMMVMQLGAHGSLYAFLHSSEDIPWSVRLRVADELSRGLAYLHGKQVVHRDIKSLNVVLDRDYHAMWCDFGLATLKSHTSSSSTTTTARTAGGVQDKVIGTTRWLAPELFARASSKPSFASDMWSFGMVLFEIATRKLPFADAISDVQLLKWIEEGTGEHIPDEVIEVCPSLCEVMRGCWCPVANRFSAGDVADRMESILNVNATKSLHQPIRDDPVDSLSIHHTPSYSPWN